MRILQFLRILRFIRKYFIRKHPVSIEPADYIEPWSFASYACSDTWGSGPTSNTTSFVNAEIDLPEKGIRFGYYFLAEGICSSDSSQFDPDAFVMKSITESLLDAPIEILAKRYSQLCEKECESLIEAAFRKASFALKANAPEPVGVTITAAFIRGRSITFGCVGANRLYWLDRKKNHQFV